MCVLLSLDPVKEKSVVEPRVPALTLSLEQSLPASDLSNITAHQSHGAMAIIVTSHRCDKQPSKNNASKEGFLVAHSSR